MDPIRNPDGPTGDSTAAVRPRTGVSSPEPTLSSANSASPTGTTCHDFPTTPLNATSFITDETKSTHSRGDSWASFSHELLYEFPISLGMAATMQEPREEPTAAARARKSSILLPKSGATLDMAFFLKNTSPNADGKTVVSKDKVNIKRMGLGIFKKKREEDTSNQKAVYNSPPRDRVEPKVTQQGSLARVQFLDKDLLTFPGLLGPNSPHQLSVPSHEDNPDAYGTETIDNWISTFSTTNQEDGLDSPTAKGISILYNTPSNSSKRNSYMLPAGTLPWSAEDNGFKLTVNNVLHQENQRDGESKMRSALSSNPPSSLNEHKRSISIPIPGYDRQITCTFDNDSLEQLIEATSQSSKAKLDRRTAEFSAVQGSRKPSDDAAQATSGSKSSVKESKALPYLPNEAVEAANNNKLTTSSMLQMWRQRDAAATTGSVKATYVPRSRRTTMIKSFGDLGHQDEELEEDGHTGAHRNSTSPSTARSSQVHVSAESTPTTNRNSMTISQVMLVAEQMPIPRGRHVNKPAPLLLRGRSGGKTKTIAVRGGDLETNYVSVQTTIPAPLLVPSPDTGVSKDSTGDTPVLLRSIKFKDLESQRPAPRAPSPAPDRSRSRAPSPQPLGQTPPGVPPRSLARLNSTTETTRPVLQQQLQEQESPASQSSASSQDPTLHFPKRSSSLTNKIKNTISPFPFLDNNTGTCTKATPTSPATPSLIK
ncbi:hypothetical protein E6O75_ATG06817 [Venturia nashicola]|uniref:Uncharacterized protein n=1 Tax=Venturia nashicola TaxID=86259 RepID=A0A4Z1PCJ0_9PEZI|nr:hypothetical protein E6O75_ATG06817 [Venturia nashicola]